MTSSTYQCFHCGGIFNRQRTDEDALAEAAQLFPDLKPEDRRIVCDECFKAVMAEFVKRN